MITEMIDLVEEILKLETLDEDGLLYPEMRKELNQYYSRFFMLLYCIGIRDGKNSVTGERK
jgi:hypothetical protein